MSIVKILSLCLLVVLVAPSIVVAIDNNNKVVDIGGLEEDNLFGTRTNYYASLSWSARKVNGTKSGEGRRRGPNLDGWKPVYLYVFSRHSIRYPKEAIIEAIHKEIPLLKEEILRAIGLNDPRYLEFSLWRPRMLLSDQMRVSESGVVETRQVAKRFNAYFPGLLNLNRIHFDVSASARPRTQQTAKAFLEGLVEHQFGFNFGLEPFPIEVMIKEALMMHIHCKSLLQAKGVNADEKSDVYNQLVSSPQFQAMLEDFSVRNRLSTTISPNMMSHVYNLCAFELAIDHKSVWCSLFNSYELSVLEYLQDLSHYHNAYGHRCYRRLGCFIISDLMRKLREVIAGKPSVASNVSLHFSHDHMLSKVYSFLQLFAQPPTYRVHPTTDRIEVDGERQFRTSRILPFNSNIAFVLYRIDSKPNDQDKGKRANPNDANSSSNNDNVQHKLMVLVMEKPIKLPGCEQLLCDVDQFFRAYGHASRNCDLQQICSQLDE